MIKNGLSSIPRHRISEFYSDGNVDCRKKLKFKRFGQECGLECADTNHTIRLIGENTATNGNMESEEQYDIPPTAPSAPSDATTTPTPNVIPVPNADQEGNIWIDTL